MNSTKYFNHFSASSLLLKHFTMTEQRELIVSGRLDGILTLSTVVDTFADSINYEVNIVSFSTLTDSETSVLFSVPYLFPDSAFVLARDFFVRSGLKVLLSSVECFKNTGMIRLTLRSSANNVYSFHIV